MLNKQLIAGLDAARACAACYVVLHHVANARGFSHGAGLFLRFGQEAVILFFLLSGFVIFANENVRALHPRGYFLRRVRRIYPVLLAAMLVSTIVFVADGEFGMRFSWLEFFGSLLALQDISALKPGVMVDPYLGNSPLWSLSYEVVFYAVFPYVLMQWRKQPQLVNHMVGGVCCALYVFFNLKPNHLLLVGAYFLIWWCGAMAANADMLGYRSVKGMLDSLLWLVALSGIAALMVFATGYHGLGVYPFLQLRHFAVAALMLVVLFSPFGKTLCTFALRGGRDICDGILHLVWTVRASLPAAHTVEVCS